MNEACNERAIKSCLQTSTAREKERERVNDELERTREGTKNR